ncbi:MAG: hypothetical protein K2Y37_06280 [Pirellulales bacterium]|nr:hypothetical protein [Pirellulales bacterium]
MEASSSPATIAEERSQQFVGRWHHLVSDTNWEKGRIVCQWRAALHEAGAAPTEFSDEAWAERIGNVSSQHVGRLRRTFLRFGEVQKSYDGLYWSHFQAAVEWTDAEMWLEGAVQNRWSIAEMRRARAETTGQVADTADETPAAEFDEDAAEDTDSVISATASLVADYDQANAEAQLVGESYDDDNISESRDVDQGSAESWDADSARSAAPAPLASLPALPDDMADAFEAFKLSILRHKLGGWSEVSADDVIAALAALKHLVLAPSGE